MMSTSGQTAEPRYRSPGWFGVESRLITYASGNFGKNLVFAGADLTFLYLLTDLFGFSGTTAGILMLVALAGDLVFDLLAAMLVIRLRRSGRGYRWLIVAGAVPGGLAFALLFAMPAMGIDRAWILAFALLVFRGAYALIDVPHNALMTRITADSRARGRVSGYRFFFSSASALTVAGVLTPAVQSAVHAQDLPSLALTGGVAGCLFALTMIACGLASDRRCSVPEHGDGDGDGIDVPLRDPLVLAMAAIAAITGFAMPAFERMLLYLCTYVMERPELVTSLLLAKTLGQFLGVAVWTPLAGRIDKGRVLAAGHAISIVGFLLFGLAMDRPSLLPACALLMGFGLSCVFMLPWGLLANAVDFVALRHGRRFETGLFAFYLVVVKASGAAASVVIGLVLGRLGYVPGMEQSAMVKAGMIALGLGVPVLGSLAAVTLLSRMGMGHERHERVLAALAAHRATRWFSPARSRSRD
ncbi:MFS transporter [Novosphingobium sp. BL-8H]|uniref:MFS transporter n=1 Tax=Novosphingobium sp. BL-8H TaxID=3127640 RepID=UPI0037577016